MKIVLIALFIGLAFSQNQALNEIQENPIPTLVYETKKEESQQIEQHQQLQGYIDIDGHFVSNQADNTQNFKSEPLVQNNQDQNSNSQLNVSDDSNNLQVSTQEGAQQLVSTDAEIDPMLDMENSLPYEFPEDTQVQEESKDQDNDNHYLSASLELPIRNENQVYDSLGNQIDSYDGMRTYLYSRIGWQLSKYKHCIVIYSKCDFQGESLPICESLKEVEDFQYDIKSIYLPEGYQVTIYSEENYQGQEVTYQESQKCLTQAISLAQLRGRQTKQIQNQDPNQSILTSNLRIRQ
ncbi:unnamed protein product (macronuclear) [Paramecium tetraurelia]|uniref:Beta/gamma crystallin 'Greek key' domain-containing protein n=1 Tax=Paramecium tetraurelia TaxID=5888 RepID=A0CJQ5_PARTE|nr:uncharacterized protein GSPATT00000734001 [Paramecium tetraurelia]CAK71022.1 unnamed protein product [Paramecium tetraurelia]|eukprot:XP_001438419.1 hypothetical protein (macronuclear) [Paramecium tetraurelia strain d4-2]